MMQNCLRFAVFKRVMKIFTLTNSTPRAADIPYPVNIRFAKLYLQASTHTDCLSNLYL